MLQALNKRPKEDGRHGISDKQDFITSTRNATSSGMTIDTSHPTPTCIDISGTPKTGRNYYVSLARTIRANRELARKQGKDLFKGGSVIPSSVGSSRQHPWSVESLVIEDPPAASKIKSPRSSTDTQETNNSSMKCMIKLMRDKLQQLAMETAEEKEVAGKISDCTEVFELMDRSARLRNLEIFVMEKIVEEKLSKSAEMQRHFSEPIGTSSLSPPLATRRHSSCLV